MSSRPLDPVCRDAVDLAKDAATAVAPAGDVGDWVEAQADTERVVTHYFLSRSPAYRGWRWAVTVARAPRSVATVDEVVPAARRSARCWHRPWLPWSDRIAPGDLGVGVPAPPPRRTPASSPATAAPVRPRGRGRAGGCGSAAPGAVGSGPRAAARAVRLGSRRRRRTLARRRLRTRVRDGEGGPRLLRLLRLPRTRRWCARSAVRPLRQRDVRRPTAASSTSATGAVRTPRHRWSRGPA